MLKTQELFRTSN